MPSPETGRREIAMKGTNKMINALLAGIFLLVHVFTGQAAAQGCVPAPSGLVGWWDGDQVSGTTVSDLSSHGNDGTIQGTVATESGKVGNAFRFTRVVGNRIVGPFTSGFAGDDSAITTSAWFLQGTVNDHPGDGVVGVGSTGPGQHFFDRICAKCGDTWVHPIIPIWVGHDGGPPDGQNRVWLGADDLGAAHHDKWWGSNSVIATGVWYYLATTYDPSTRQVKIYINGVSDRTVTLSTGLSLTANFSIGGDAHNDNAFDGLIDEVQIYNRALSASEILAIFNAGSAGVCKGLTLAIDIKPGSDPNSINPRSRGKIPVGILSGTAFDASAQVDKTSLTFGRTGDEPSLEFCHAEDVNRDGLTDLVCHFDTRATGFQPGDTQGVLKGRTVSGQPLQGTDSVKIVP
jgi:hypothetical protein